MSRNSHTSSLGYDREKDRASSSYGRDRNPRDSRDDPRDRSRRDEFRDDYDRSRRDDNDRHIPTRERARDPPFPAGDIPTGPRSGLSRSTTAPVPGGGPMPTATALEARKDAGLMTELVTRAVCELSDGVSKQSAARIRLDELDKHYKQREDSYRKVKSLQSDFPSIAQQQEQHRDRCKLERDSAAKEYDACKQYTTKKAAALATLIQKTLPDPKTQEARSSSQDAALLEQLAAFEGKFKALEDSVACERQVHRTELEFVKSQLEAHREELQSIEAHKEELRDFKAQLLSQDDKVAQERVAREKEVQDLKAQLLQERESREKELQAVKAQLESVVARTVQEHTKQLQLVKKEMEAKVEQDCQDRQTQDQTRRQEKLTQDKERSDLLSELGSANEQLRSQLEDLRSQATLLSTEQGRLRDELGKYTPKLDDIDSDAWERLIDFGEFRLNYVLTSIEELLSRPTQAQPANDLNELGSDNTAVTRLEQELKDLRDQLAASVSKAALRRMFGPQFENIISSCGLLVEEVKGRVAATEGRLKVLENHMSPLPSPEPRGKFLEELKEGLKEELTETFEQKHASLASQVDDKYDALTTMVTQLDGQYQNINTKSMVDQIAQHYRNSQPISHQIHRDFQELANRQTILERTVDKMMADITRQSEEPRHKRPRTTTDAAGQLSSNGNGAY